MSSNVAVCWELRAIKSGGSLRLTSLSALFVVFVGQRLYALGKISDGFAVPVRSVQVNLISHAQQRQRYRCD
jgi:hypothetical protein